MEKSNILESLGDCEVASESNDHDEPPLVVDEKDRSSPNYDSSRQWPSFNDSSYFDEALGENTLDERLMGKRPNCSPETTNIHAS